jgi:hypothetical protein
VAIGLGAGQSNQRSNTICINATGSNLNIPVGVTGGFYLAPIRYESLDVHILR